MSFPFLQLYKIEWGFYFSILVPLSNIGAKPTKVT